MFCDLIVRWYAVPFCVFVCLLCQVLKVDHNNLVEIPSHLGRLERLTSFNCASQRPRVRLLPGSITRLHQLQVSTGFIIHTAPAAFHCLPRDRIRQSVIASDR